MKFLKAGEVRIEQLRDEIRNGVIEFPSQDIQWNGVDGVNIEDIDGKATDNQIELQVIVDDHVLSMEYFADEKAQADQERAIAIRPQIIAEAQNLVGVSVLDMDVTQLKDLLRLIAFKAGAIDPSDLTIRPLAEWVK